jgi:ribonuclease HII
MRQHPDAHVELALWAQGYAIIAGIDEAGRGAWAGPVVAAAVCLPPDETTLRSLHPVCDSKLLTPACRERCYGLVTEAALAYATGQVASTVIDQMGIVPATRLAMKQAVLALDPPPSYLLIDFLRLEEIALPQDAIVKGDRYCLSIAAASIIAKVTRDRLMLDLDRAFPGYGFAQHKGYGTARHQQSLRRLGASPEHRRSFAPLRPLCEG